MKIQIEKTTLEQALEALKAMQSYAAAERKGLRICDEAITKCEEALAQPALPVQRQPLTDEQANKLLWIGAVSAPNGAIYREPLSYRKELMAHRLQGLRLGEAAHNIGEMK